MGKTKSMNIITINNNNYTLAEFNVKYVNEALLCCNNLKYVGVALLCYLDNMFNKVCHFNIVVFTV